MKGVYLRALLLVLLVMVLFPSLAGQFLDYAKMLAGFLVVKSK